MQELITQFLTQYAQTLITAGIAAVSAYFKRKYDLNDLRKKGLLTDKKQ